jgi:hypothetical protein
MAWKFGASALFGLMLFFFLVEPARAPKGGRQSLGGRTIASLQEEDFDRRLLHLQLCYGVRVVADECTLERRRVCKALVVHHLEKALSPSGSYLKNSLEFRCEDTAIMNPTSFMDEGVVSLRPNTEKVAIESVLEKSLTQIPLTTAQDKGARDACDFLADCKWAMRPQAFSFRKLATCLGTANFTHRKVLLDHIGAMLFHAKSGQNRALYPELTESIGN